MRQENGDSILLISALKQLSKSMVECGRVADIIAEVVLSKTQKSSMKPLLKGGLFLGSSGARSRLRLASGLRRILKKTSR